jgi:hypothetical protein
MKNSNVFGDLMKRYAAAGILILVLLISATVAFSHGGKHSAGELTHLQALKKSIGLYERLLNSEKLDQSWEHNLVRVDVSNRQKGSKKEIVVAFQRTEGDPSAVYIFFDAVDGKYSGSNFTGK